MQKKEARSYHKRIRNEMTPQEVSGKSALIAERILQSEQLATAEYILAYYPLGNEVSLLPVMEYCFHHNTRIAFPRVLRKHKSGDSDKSTHGDDSPRMEFYEIKKLSQLSEGTFHVMEPMESLAAINWEQDWREAKTLVLTPGVAFDIGGARVGYGKGYYDYFFDAHPGCIRMGVAYENQVEEHIEMDDRDIAMQYLVTEDKMIDSRITNCRKRQKIRTIE